jgi:hypothetical protein
VEAASARACAPTECDSHESARPPRSSPSLTLTLTLTLTLALSLNHLPTLTLALTLSLLCEGTLEPAVPRLDEAMVGWIAVRAEEEKE